MNEIQLPRVFVGCMRVDQAGDSLYDFVKECVEMGAAAFDHAPVYGGFTVEQIFGDLVLRREPALRDRMFIASKTGIRLAPSEFHSGIYYDSSPKAVRAEVDQSLTKLGTDRLDLLLVHRHDPMALPGELGAVLDDLVDAGKVLSVGVSNYTPGQVGALQGSMRTRLVANQVELSALRTESLFDGTVDDAIERTMQVMAWSPLAGGEVFTQTSGAGARVHATAAAIAGQRRIGIDTVLYAWIFGIGARASVVTGTMKASRVRAAIEAAEIQLTRDEWYGLLEASRGWPVP